MEARRHRLILLAYLRDPSFITPGYPHGVKSILRENLILNGIQSQKDVDIALARMQIESGFAPLMSGHAAMRTLNQLYQNLKRLSALSEFDTLRVPEISGSIDALAKLYHAMEASDIFEKIQEYTYNPEED